MIAVGDPDAAISELASFLGVAPGVSGGRHATWGTRNRLLWFGDTYIELCTVTDARLAERSWLGLATLRALATADAAIGWAISTDNLDLDRAAMNASGASLGAPVAGERRRPDGRIVRWRLALPAHVDLARPFLIEHDLAAAEWTPEDRAARAAGPARVLGIELPVDAVEGLPTSTGEAKVGDQLVRVAGPATGRPTVRIDGLGRSGIEAVLLGCRWLLE